MTSWCISARFLRHCVSARRLMMATPDQIDAERRHSHSQQGSVRKPAFITAFFDVI